MKFIDCFIFICTMLSCIGLGFIYSEMQHTSSNDDSFAYNNVSNNTNYYPKYADIKDIKIQYYNNSTVIIINKKLLPITISCDSYSMATWMGCGNYGFKEKYSKQTLFVGDVIIFKNPWNQTGTVIHQIINITDECVFTKGINNKYADNECIKKSDIDGRMWFMLPTSNDTIS